MLSVEQSSITQSRKRSYSILKKLRTVVSITRDSFFADMKISTHGLQPAADSSEVSEVTNETSVPETPEISAGTSPAEYVITPSASFSAVNFICWVYAALAVSLARALFRQLRRHLNCASNNQMLWVSIITTAPARR